MKTKALLLLALLAVAAQGGVVTHYLTLDTATQTRPFNTTITRGSTPLLRVELMNNRLPETNLSGGYLFYAPLPTSAEGVMVEGVIVGNHMYVQFDSTNSLGLEADNEAYPIDYWAQVVATNETGGVYEWSQGRLRIRSGGAVDGAASTRLVIEDYPGMTWLSVDMTGTHVYEEFEEVKTIQVDRDRGFYLTNVAPGVVRLYMGSHWHTIFTDGGEPLIPSGAQNIMIEARAGITNTFTDLTTDPVTLVIPGGTDPAWLASPIVQSITIGDGFYQDDGETLLRGGLPIAAEVEIIAPTNWGVEVYGTNPAANVSFVPEGDNLQVKMVVDGDSTYLHFRALSAAQGPRGADGIGDLFYAGAWSSDNSYPSPHTLVSYGGNVYYTASGQELAKPTTPPDNPAEWSLFIAGGTDGDPGADGAPGVNLVFAGEWETSMELTTNHLVSYLGSAYVPKEYMASAPRPDENPELYTTLMQRGADGASGEVVSNLMFAGSWQWGVAYPQYSVVPYDGGLVYAAEDITGDGGYYPNPPYAPWTVAVSRGTDGASGQHGKDGKDGIGNMYFAGTWEPDRIYQENDLVAWTTLAGQRNVYRAKSAHWSAGGRTPSGDGAADWQLLIASGTDANAIDWSFTSTYSPEVTYENTLLRHGGAVYYTLQPVSGVAPPNPAYWGEFVRDGTSLSTNLIWRGTWVAGTYTSNDLVSHQGSAYYVKTVETTATPPSPDWGVFVSQGPPGPMGPASTNDIWNITNITVVLTQLVSEVTYTNITYGTNFYTFTTNYVNHSNFITVVSNFYDFSDAPLQALTNVFIDDVTAGQGLVWSGEHWINATVSGAGGGGGAVEFLPIRLWATEPVVTLAGGANSWNQRLSGITAPVTLQMPLKSNTDMAAYVHLLIDNPSGHAVGINTTDPPVDPPYPHIPTDAPSRILFLSPANSDRWIMRAAP